MKSSRVGLIAIKGFACRLPPRVQLPPVSPAFRSKDEFARWEDSNECMESRAIKERG